MSYKKGECGNPNGRPKGSINKTTQKIRESLSDLLDGFLPSLKKDLKMLDPKDRVSAVIKLMDYYVPKASQNINLDHRVDIGIERILKDLCKECDDDVIE
ncbi:MAG: hypothetical protein RR386_05865 [Bacteroidaceae bacterium]